VSDIVIDQSDRGRTFEVTEGDLVLVRLAENPTTGYRWEMDAVDERILSLQCAEYSEEAEAGIGGGGTRTFSFEAESPGAVQIRLRLRRAWEPEEAAADQFAITIDVQGE
jgi:predicted secreted protein